MYVLSTFLATLSKTVFMLKPLEVVPWRAGWYNRQQTDNRHTDIATYGLKRSKDQFSESTKDTSQSCQCTIQIG